MVWLWVVAPLVIVAGAVWLAIGTRRLTQTRLDAGGDVDPQLGRLGRDQGRLRSTIDRLASRRSADPGSDARDR